MKNRFYVSALLLCIASIFGVNTIKAQKNNLPTTPDIVKAEVIYFHYTRRCVTCQAVETEALKAVKTLYPEQYKSGIITFKSVNLDEKESKALADRCKAEGQALLVISGSKKTDLTEKSFMYARNNPEQLKQEIKKVIDKLIE
jgi:hypothetical protein